MEIPVAARELGLQSIQLINSGQFLFIESSHIFRTRVRNKQIGNSRLPCLFICLICNYHFLFVCPSYLFAYSTSSCRFKSSLTNNIRVLVFIPSPCAPKRSLQQRSNINMPPHAYPPYPALRSLRLAIPSDIPRIAELSVLGFRDSEIFRYLRPHYKEVPQDAVASFAKIYRSQLLDPRAVVVVAEDWWKPDEVSHFTSTTDNQPHKDEQFQKRVVAGVASWILPEGSPRTGEFVIPNVSDPSPSLDRDLSQKGSRSLAK